MKRTWKCLTALLLACTLAVGLPGPIGAAWAAPEDGTLVVAPGSTEELEDLNTVNVGIELYQVASAERDGDNFTYTLGARYSALQPGLDQMLTAPTGDAMLALSRQAAQAALGAGTKAEPAYTGTAGRRITGIEPGLYLVVAHSDVPADYLGTIEAEDGSEILVSRIQTVDWIYTYAPQLVFVPGKPLDEAGNDSPINPGSWLFNVSMTLKPTRERRVGSLEIVKTLTDFVADHPGFFVFRVDVYLDGMLYDSMIRELRFNAAGQDSIVIEDLPNRAEVTVTEVYSGASYRLTSEQVQSGTIAVDEVTQVEFTNSGSTGEGGAIVNHFSYDSEGGWAWTPIPVVE